MAAQGEWRTRRAVLRGAAATAVAGLFAACGELASRPTVIPSPTPPPTGGTQAVAQWAKPPYPHPLFAVPGAGEDLARLLFGSLLSGDDTGAAMPDLGAMVERGTDARTWVCTLRPGARFSDGLPVTARDVVFTLERALDPRVGNPWRVRLLALEGAAEYAAGRAASVRGLETPDDATTVMRLVAPDALWHHALAAGGGLPVLPAHALANAPPERLAAAPFARPPAPVAGPFALAEWGGGAELALRRNGAYTGTVPARLDRLVLRSFPRQETALVALERGELDAAPVPALELSRLRKQPHLTIARVPGGVVTALAANCTRPYLGDKRVRQAMLHALDRAAMVKDILKGEGAVANGVLAGAGGVGVSDMAGPLAELTPYPYSPRVARLLLADAGWPTGRRLTLTYVPGDRTGDATVAALQQGFREAGLALDLLQVDTAEYVRRVHMGATPQAAGDFDLALVNIATRREPDAAAAFVTAAAFAPAGANIGHYANVRVDDLFARGRGTADRAVRRLVYDQLAQLLNDELPLLPLWTATAIYAHHRRLRGFKPPADPAHLLWNADEWSIAP